MLASHGVFCVGVGGCGCVCVCVWWGGGGGQRKAHELLCMLAGLHAKAPHAILLACPHLILQHLFLPFLPPLYPSPRPHPRATPIPQEDFKKVVTHRSGFQFVAHRPDAPTFALQKWRWQGNRPGARSLEAGAPLRPPGWWPAGSGGQQWSLRRGHRWLAARRRLPLCGGGGVPVATAVLSKASVTYIHSHTNGRLCVFHLSCGTPCRRLGGDGGEHRGGGGAPACTGDSHAGAPAQVRTHVGGLHLWQVDLPQGA